MEFKIKNLGNLRIVGIKERIHTSLENVNEQNSNGIPEIWHNAGVSGLITKLMEINDGELVGAVGVCTNYDEDGSMDYYVGVNSTKNIQDCVELEIKECQYAVFECSMTNIQETWRYIFSEWLPTADYEFVNAPSFEYYPSNEKCEIYIPIK